MHRRTLIAALVSPQCRKLTMGFIHCRVVKRVIISHRARRIMQGVRSDTSPSPPKYNDKLSLYFFRESGRVQYIHALSRGVASTEAVKSARVPSRHHALVPIGLSQQEKLPGTTSSGGMPLTLSRCILHAGFAYLTQRRFRLL